MHVLGHVAGGQATADKIRNQWHGIRSTHRAPYEYIAVSSQGVSSRLKPFNSQSVWKGKTATKMKSEKLESGYFRLYKNFIQYDWIELMLDGY